MKLIIALAFLLFFSGNPGYAVTGAAGSPHAVQKAISCSGAAGSFFHKAANTKKVTCMQLEVVVRNLAHDTVQPSGSLPVYPLLIPLRPLLVGGYFMRQHPGIVPRLMARLLFPVHYFW